MFKAELLVKICLAAIILSFFNINGSVAKNDCDGGYGNAGPTIPEGYTSLPDPEEVPMVVVNIGDQYMVWDPGQNKFAKILNNNGSQYITFPCEKAVLDHWLNNTSAVSSNNLYFMNVLGETNDLLPECSANPPMDGCDSCTDTVSTTSLLNACVSQLTNTFNVSRTYCRFTSGIDDQTFHQNSDVIMEAKKNELFRSHQLQIRNDSNVESACARTKKEINNTTELNFMYDEGDQYKYYRDIISYTIYTPIGILAQDLNLSNESHLNYNVVEDNYQSEDYINADGRFMIGFYTDTVMLQIYLYQYCKASRYRPCARGLVSGWIPTSYECDWEEANIDDRVMEIQAQLNVFPNADSVDPTSLSRNSAFEQALISLLNRYNSINGIGDKEIGATSFTVNFRQGL